MKIQKMKYILCCVLLAAFAIQLSACATGIQTVSAADPVDLMESVQPKQVQNHQPDAVFADAAAEFAVGLLRETYEDGKNLMISPQSVLTALAMTANGANGDTLTQMESVLGLPIGELNAYLGGSRELEGGELVAANSIWIREEFRDSVKEEFLQTNADYYGAGIFTSSFEQQTVEDINAWVSEHTGGRIEKMLGEISPNVVMYLINALSFDATWGIPYTQEQISDGVFYAADGTMQTVQMMCAEERKYINDGTATGFMKDYQDGNYSFIALLPNEDISMEAYIASLTGAALLETISGAQDASVVASMPKFTVDSDLTLNDALIALGMSDAFDIDKADLSRIGDELYIVKVLHKTWLSVDECGTQAGAATSVEIADKAVVNAYSVELNRPFVCAIINNQTNTLVFFGVINSIGE